MKIRKHLKGVRFDLIESDPEQESYRNGGEYQALKWLKAYTENKTGEPRVLFEAMLRTIQNSSDVRNDALFIYTLYPFI